MSVESVRTDDEIVSRIEELRDDDLFGFGTQDLLARLPSRLAKRWMAEGFEGTTWEPLARDRESILAEMRDYMSFAWDKANDERGLSTSRSVSHYRSWLWLIGDGATLAFLEDDSNYAMYGRPMLRKVCEVYGYPIEDDHAEEPTHEA